MQQQIIKAAFTLVELIVVITILAILWTIGFLSFQGYSISARDSARISDISTISKSLELFKIREWYYPNPSGFYNISYSWSLAWRQGTFGSDVQQQTKRITTIPVDPLTGNEYSYSTINSRQEYELWAITENLVSYDWNVSDIHNKNSLIPNNWVYAENTFFSYTVGNYNKQIVTVKDSVNPNILYVLWVPTIITTEITDVTVQEIVSNQSFAVKGSKNLPSSYALVLPNSQTHTWSISFTPWNISLTAPLIYEGTINDLDSESERIQFWENLVSYYQNSNLVDDLNYKQIANILTGEELEYVNTLIRTDTGWLPGDDITIPITSANTTILLPSTWVWCEFDVHNFNQCDFQ